MLFSIGKLKEPLHAAAIHWRRDSKEVGKEEWKMLILTARIGYEDDQIVFEDEVMYVHPVQVNGRQVRLRIVAPRNFIVLREEIFDDPDDPDSLPVEGADCDEIPDGRGSLILTRRIGEKFMVYYIFDGKWVVVTLTVLGVNGNQVRIGVSAPTEPKRLVVLRRSIYNRDQEEQAQRHQPRQSRPGGDRDDQSNQTGISAG